MPKPLDCELCKEIESVFHLFFECIVAKKMWELVSQVFDVDTVDFKSLASKWLCNTRYMHLNIVTSVVLWSIWNNRNNIVFNRCTWINMKQVWRLALSYLKLWMIPLKDQAGGKAEQFASLLLAKLRAPLAIEPG